MKTILIATALVFSAPLFAQVSDNASKFATQVQAKNDALDAFKNGDQVSGLAKLKGNLNTETNSPKTEIQLVAQLTEVTYWLANEKHPRAVETALLTIAQSESSRVKLSRSEEAATLAASGELYERVVGDSVKAKASYDAALQRDSTHGGAKRGAARMLALQALIDAKARENDVLRARAQNPIR